MGQLLHVGVDDTDSPRMGCTTYVAALLVDHLTKRRCTFVDYPNLVRLNPNVPWKTRGNGAVCLRFTCSDENISSLVESVVGIVKRNSDLAHGRTDPAVACLRGPVPSELSLFSKKVIRGLVRIKEVQKVAAKFRISCIPLKGRKGIIGATAAIGENLQGDHTYELIAYRISRNRSTPRRVDAESVSKMAKETEPLTFNNMDPETGRILITPRGKDPILYGIRGETPEVVLRSHRIVKATEKVERWVIFRTNHGTDDHFSQLSRISNICPFRPAFVTGRVSANPRTIPGGHVILELSDGSGSIDCAAYEPTGSFRHTVRKLVRGDLVEAYGGVRRGTKTHACTLNLEKIRIADLAENIAFQNPLCLKCGKRMESAGRGQGFRCPNCKTTNRAASKIPVVNPRELALGMYIPPARAHRHLTKPASRYGREKTGPPMPLIQPWHWP